MADTDKAAEVLAMILRERTRQLKHYGWSHEHDREHHRNGQLVYAACAYAVASLRGCLPQRGRLYRLSEYIDGAAYRDCWPLNWTDKRTATTQIRCLVKAAALLVAEIERIQNEGGSDA